jgi:hypothetical protein
MTLRPLPSEFPYILGKFYFIFYQCSPLAKSTDSYRSGPKNIGNPEQNLMLDCFFLPPNTDGSTL